MSELVTKLAEQVPSLVVLVFLVFKFLSYLKEDRIRTEKHLETLAASCHQVQREASSAIKENTKRLAGIAEILRGHIDGQELV